MVAVVVYFLSIPAVSIHTEMKSWHLINDFFFLHGREFITLKNGETIFLSLISLICSSVASSTSGSEFRLFFFLLDWFAYLRKQDPNFPIYS